MEMRTTRVKATFRGEPRTVHYRRTTSRPSRIFFFRDRPGPVFAGQVSAGDDQKLSQLYRRYGAVIYWRCHDILRDAASAEDATQETFLRVHRHLGRVPDDEEALRWIWRVATNYCLNEVRNRRRRPQPAETLPETAARGLPVDQALADRQLFERVVDRVAAKLRAVAWLRYVDEVDAAEAGRLLGVTERTVTNRLTAFHDHARKIIGRLS